MAQRPQLTRDEKISRGERVKHLLENEDFKSAFRMARQVCLENVGRAVTPDDAWRAACHVQAVDRLWGAIRAYWAEGEAAMQDLLAEQAALREDTREADAMRARLEQAEIARREWDQWSWSREEEQG